MRILAFAYACEPQEGSEPGTGWAWARLLARFGETWVVTRSNNRPSIESGIGRIPERDRLRFVYVDLPRWARFWKQGGRGIRSYYVLWNLAALRKARRLERDVPFDLVWHVTLANAWLGSAAGLMGRPFVFGPVGGGVTVPWRLAPVLGVRGTVYEAARTGARGLGRYLNPLARVAWRRATLILVQNRETRRWLPFRHRHKAVVLPHVILERSPVTRDPRRGKPPTALFAARLLPWKGAALAIGMLRELPGWRLLVCGEGSDQARLRRLARRFGVEDRISFLGKLPRPEVLELMRSEADVFVHPSLREEGGWAVGEALYAGVPVVCIDRGGPPLLGARTVSPSSRRQTTAALSREAAAAVWDGRTAAKAFDPNTRFEELKRLLASHGLLPETLERRS